MSRSFDGTPHRRRARTHECVTHLHSDPQPGEYAPAPAPLEKSESKKAFRGLRKQMSKLTGVRGVISKPSSAEP